MSRPQQRAARKAQKGGGWDDTVYAVLEFEGKQRDAAAAAAAAAKAKAESAAFNVTYVDVDRKTYPAVVTPRPNSIRVTIPSGTIDRGNAKNNKPTKSSELNAEGTGGSSFSLRTTLENFKAEYLDQSKKFEQLSGDDLPGYFTKAMGGRRRKTRRRHGRKTRRSRK